MTYLPPSPRIIAAARDTLQDLPLLVQLTAEQRRNLCDVSFDILRDARAARLGLQASAPAGPATIHYLTRAEFRDGHHATRRRPRIIVQPVEPTPGDAA